MKDRFIGKGFLPLAAVLAALFISLPVQAQDLSKASPHRTRASGRQVTPVSASLPSGLSVLASDWIEVRKSANVTGNVVVNSAVPGPFPSGFSLSIDGATISGTAKGASVNLAKFSTVTNLCRDTLTNGGGTVTGVLGPYSASGPAPCNDTPPFFSPLPPFSSANPSSIAVNVPFNSSLTIGPNRYGTITVGKNATLFVTGGLVEAQSVHLDQGAKLLFQSASEVRVAGRFNATKQNTVGPASGSGIGAVNIVIYVEGFDATSAAFDSAGVVGEASTATANFYVANGTFDLGKSASLTGAVVAKSVILETSSALSASNAFTNQAPTAESQNVLTNGAASIEIILKGSDPEGEDLAFAIVSGPNTSVGSITPPTPITPSTPPDRCSISATMCTTDANCPMGETCLDGGEAGPVTMASVTYTPVNPGANELNTFSFQVADPKGATAVAVVTVDDVNDTSPPPPPATAVSAPNVTAETTTDVPVTIGLTAGACQGSVIVFAITSLPSGGTLSDGGNDIESTPHTLSGSSVVFTPNPGFTGNPTFGYSATDTGTVGACTTTVDTGIVTVNVAAATDLAPDQEVQTGLNTPVQFLLGGPNQMASAPLKMARIGAAPSRAELPLPGATIAGNVSSTNGSTGDGRNNLPGPAPIFISAGVDVNLGASTVALFGDLASWQTAIGASPGSTQDFSGFAPGASVQGATILPGVTLSSNFGSFTVFTTSPDNAVFGFDGTTRSVGNGYYQLDFTQTYNAVSFVVESWDPAAGGPAVVEVTLLNGTVVTHNVSKTTGTEADPVFIGLRSPNFPITRVRFNEPPEVGGSGNEETVLDDISVANNDPGIHGVVRTQIEWDVSTLPLNADGIESCEVTLITHLGSAAEVLDTTFFAGAAEQNGTLDLADFQAAIGVLSLANMPISVGSLGNDVAFSFDVTGAVKSARNAGFNFFSIQGRVDEQEAGGGSKVGLQIRSSASGNLSNLTEPKLTCITTSTPPPVVRTWEVVNLPGGGKLLDASGALVTAGQTFNFQPTLTFVSPVAGSFSFNYKVTFGAVVDTALVTLVVGAGDSCLVDGRRVNCSQSQCSDGIDNDGDFVPAVIDAHTGQVLVAAKGGIDWDGVLGQFPADPACAGNPSNSEFPVNP